MPGASLRPPIGSRATLGRSWVAFGSARSRGDAGSDPCRRQACAGSNDRNPAAARPTSRVPLASSRAEDDGRERARSASRPCVARIPLRPTGKEEPGELKPRLAQPLVRVPGPATRNGSTHGPISPPAVFRRRRDHHLVARVRPAPRSEPERSVFASTASWVRLSMAGREPGRPDRRPLNT